MQYLLALVVLGLIGCAPPETSEVDQSATSSNKIGLNKIGLNKIGLNKIGLNKIGLNKIGLNKIGLNALTAGELLNSPDCNGTNDTSCGGRDVLEYLIGCALPAGVTLVGTADNGQTYEFAGAIGLAPQWEQRRLTVKEQRWVSACMLARVNNFGVKMFISLRGPHPALTVSAEESNEYELQEGAFFGDIFAERADDGDDDSDSDSDSDSDGDGDSDSDSDSDDNDSDSDDGDARESCSNDVQRYYACRGSDLYAGNFGDVAKLRACAQPTDAGDKTLCGMTYAGECDAFNVERACENVLGDHYGRCHTTPSEKGTWKDRSICNRFEEVITVYVQRAPEILP